MVINVFLADDHRLMVEGFRMVLQRSDIQVVDVAYTLDGLPARFAKSKADVLVIDVRFDGADGQNGLDICEEILREKPNTKIVVFSQFDDPWTVEKTYRLGVFAFVRKDEDTDILVEAIRSAHARKEYFTPLIAQQLALAAVKVIKVMNPTRLLDEKELQIFTMVADGRSTTEITESVGLAYKTVSTIIKGIKQKLGIETAADITKLAIKFGITNLDVKTKN